MRTAAALLLAIFLGQALGLPALEGPCALAQCADEQRADAGTAQERERGGDCTTPCSACLCCAPIRTLPPLGATLAAVAVTPAKLPIARDVVPPQTPPHEILHVPKSIA